MWFLACDFTSFTSIEQRAGCVKDQFVEGALNPWQT